MWFILCCKKWSKFIKFGVLLHPKQKYKCRDCGKQFVLNPEKYISQEKKDIIDKLLLEKISLRGIARSVGISGVWGWSNTP
jgi:transposase-like protein